MAAADRRATYARTRLLADAALLAAALAWVVGSRRLPAFVLPSPQSVLRLAAALFFDPTLAGHTYTSLLRVVASVALSLGLGLGLVIAAYYVQPLRVLVVERLVPLLNAFPTVGWAILAVYWLGVNDAAIVAVETAIILPFALINLWEALRTLDPEVLEMGHSFTRSRPRILRRVILPLLGSEIFATVRLAYGVAWKVALVAEIFGTQRGLGYLMLLAQTEYNTPLLVATVVVVVLLVYLVDRLVLERVYRRLARGLTIV